jgi:hypothetical protein
MDPGEEHPAGIHRDQREEQQGRRHDGELDRSLAS